MNGEHPKTAAVSSKQKCTCAETCKRLGKPFPTDWSWECQRLPYTQEWRPAGETCEERCRSGLGHQGEFLWETQCTLREGHAGSHQYASDPRPPENG